MATRPQKIALNLKQLRSRAEGFLWHEHPENLPRWQRQLARTLQIVYAVGRDLGSGQLSLRAMSLVYYTVIAMVPLLALTFSVVKGLGVHNAMEPALLGVLEPFLGEYSTTITDNVVGFVDNIRVDVLSFVSIGVLLYTVLTMMKQMESAFNYIWNVAQPRTLANRISEYLFAVICTPLLILISVGIASYVSTNIFVRHLESLTIGAPILHFIGVITPLFLMSLAFAFAYSFIPNTRVHFKSALIGGFVTTLAWQALAWIFSNFITEYSANAVIYAAFFAIILLMLLIYLGWFVLLVGSSVAYYHQYPAKTRTGRDRLRLSIVEQEEITLTVASLIIGRFQRGEGPWSLDEIINYTQLNGQVLETAVSTLIDIGFIHPTADDPKRYLPAMSVDRMSILDLHIRIRKHAIDHILRRDLTREQKAVRDYLAAVDEALQDRVGQQAFRLFAETALDEPDTPTPTSHTDKKEARKTHG